MEHHYFRYYGPATGRYLSTDPLGQEAGPDPHGHVPHPLYRTDPLGLTRTAGHDVLLDTDGEPLHFRAAPVARPGYCDFLAARGRAARPRRTPRTRSPARRCSGGAVPVRSRGESCTPLDGGSPPPQHFRTNPESALNQLGSAERRNHPFSHFGPAFTSRSRTRGPPCEGRPPSPTPTPGSPATPGCSRCSPRWRSPSRPCSAWPPPPAPPPPRATTPRAPPS
ncbi:hypothetical protein [Kitasatospora sp. SolWspMP-SS2h]|uniref:hypothetical protein n=1 Tax=Kitasatospora sp. SolWspMP-SS2h TaxID=1305729 RepID=UPI0011B941A8